MSKPIVIIGAGLSGTLMAIRLAQRGFKVELFESRHDMRSHDISAGRSINLALSSRGLNALQLIGGMESVMDELIPMNGRMVHLPDGTVKLQQYSGRSGEYINSVSRGGLNIALLNRAESYANIRIHFNMPCTHVNLDTATAVFRDPASHSDQIVEAELIIGADGAFSAVRQSMMHQAARLRFNYRVDWLSHGYKELIFPPTPDGDYALEKNALHIWPRGGFMMIALPNPGGSFTVTLFLPFEGSEGFGVMKDGPSVSEYFQKWFPEAISLLPNLENAYFEHPVSALGTVKCYPWSAYGKSVLIGDAAHAVVPFYGQGMNCSFEDCVSLDQCIDKYGDDWTKVLDAFQQERKPNADAIADLAVENFYEMRDHVADPVFMRKRQLEMRLEQTFPDYYSKYSLVTFRADVPYADAQRIGNAQDRWLMEFSQSDRTIPDTELASVHASLRAAIAAIPS